MNQNDSYSEDLQNVKNECLLLKDLINRFEYSYNLLINNKEESYYNKPFLYLEDLLYFRKNFELLISAGDFNDFQLRYCKKLLSLIKKFITDDTYTYELEIDDYGYYYIKISIQFQNIYNDLFILYPFTRMIYIHQNQYKKEIIDKINICESNINDLRENEKVLMTSKKNPLISSENPMDMLKISLNKKKYAMKFSDLLKENDNNINECYNLLANYKTELEEIDNFESCLDLNRENFLSDIKRSPFELYLSKELEQIESVQENIQEIDQGGNTLNYGETENVKNDLKDENPISDIIFFE